MDAPTEPLIVTLPDDAREVVEASLAAGEFETAAEAVRHAIMLLGQEREEETKALRRRIERSLADPRPPIPLDDAFALVRARIEARRRGR